MKREGERDQRKKKPQKWQEKKELTTAMSDGETITKKGLKKILLLQKNLGTLGILPFLGILTENYRVSKCLQKFKLLSLETETKDLLRPSQSCDSMTFHGNQEHD